MTDSRKTFISGIYALDLSDFTRRDIADLIVDWRENEEAGIEAAAELLRSIENWLRAEGK